MKHLIILVAIAISICAAAKPPLLISANTTPIILQGTGDTAITLPRVYLEEFISYNSHDSAATIGFTQFRNSRQAKNGLPVSTDVPVNAMTFKVPAGTQNIYSYVMNQAILFYQSLGYSAVKL